MSLPRRVLKRKAFKPDPESLHMLGPVSSPPAGVHLTLWAPREAGAADPVVWGSSAHASLAGRTDQPINDAAAIKRTVVICIVPAPRVAPASRQSSPQSFHPAQD